MRGSFNESNISSFLSKVTTGSAGYDKIPGNVIEIKRADKWDGKDAQPIVEEPEEENEEL